MRYICSIYISYYIIYNYIWNIYGIYVYGAYVKYMSIYEMCFKGGIRDSQKRLKVKGGFKGVREGGRPPPPREVQR